MAGRQPPSRGLLPWAEPLGQRGRLGINGAGAGSGQHTARRVGTVRYRRPPACASSSRPSVVAAGDRVRGRVDGAHRGSAQRALPTASSIRAQKRNSSLKPCASVRYPAVLAFCRPLSRLPSASPPSPQIRDSACPQWRFRRAPPIWPRAAAAPASHANAVPLAAGPHVSSSLAALGAVCRRLLWTLFASNCVSCTCGCMARPQHRPGYPFHLARPFPQLTSKGLLGFNYSSIAATRLLSTIRLAKRQSTAAFHAITDVAPLHVWRAHGPEFKNAAECAPAGSKKLMLQLPSRAPACPSLSSAAFRKRKQPAGTTGAAGASQPAVQKHQKPPRQKAHGDKTVTQGNLISHLHLHPRVRQLTNLLAHGPTRPAPHMVLYH